MSSAESEAASKGDAASTTGDTTAVDPSGLPVERRSEVLTEQLNDCFQLLWDWALCGGPKARLHQLYVHGRLARCMDEYQKLKQCLVSRTDAAKRPSLAPAPHPLWQIRTRGEAATFWEHNYAHLRERGAGNATDGLI